MASQMAECSLSIKAFKAGEGERGFETQGGRSQERQKRFIERERRGRIVR